MKNYRLSRPELLFLLVLSATRVLQADTFTVTRTNNTGPGSLPVVISQANAAPGEHTIEFAVTGTITLVSPLPTITKNLTITGRVDSPVAISGGGTTTLFTFAAGTTNVLNHLNLANGNTTNGGGAAINNAGILFVTECDFINNVARNGSGGAVNNAGSLTIVSSTISGNAAATGGGIYSSGSLTITDSQLLNNQAGNGGAVFNAGTLAIGTATVSSNQATLGFGGGIYNDGRVSAYGTTISHNQATGGAGGDACCINSAGGGGGGFGGGLFTVNGVASITNCTIFGNSAFGGRGGNISGGDGARNGGGNNGGVFLAPNWHGGFGGGGAGGYSYSATITDGAGGNGGFGGGGGGGMYSLPGWAGTGGFGGGDAAGVNANQYAGVAGGGGAGFGAGVFIENGDLSLINCTITANTVRGGPGGVGSPTGGSGQGIGGGIFNHSGTVRLLNAIADGNTATETSADLYGAFVSTGFNLIGNNQGATGLNINDYQGVPASLGPLQDNGGPTLTCALLQGSLAIGSGTSAGAPSTDQRGIPRPSGHVDIGAFQIVTLLTPTIAWPAPADIIYGTALGSQQLNAAVGVDGTLTYTPPAGTLLLAGPKQVLTVVFTPANLAQYTTATKSVLINVAKANQTITFSPLPDKKLGDPPVLLTASVGAGLPVSFDVVSGPATMTGSLLVLGSASGLVTVRATQPGDANYNAAPYVERSFLLGTSPLPIITTQPNSQAASPGDRISLSVVATGEALTYQWRFDGQSIPGGTGPTLVLARVRASQAGPYDVLVTNPSGSIASQVARLTVNILTGSPIILTQPQGQAVRLGEGTTLSVVASGATPNLVYQWYRGSSGDTSALILGATNASYTVLGLTTNTAFWVNVRNSLGMVDSDSALVTLSPATAAKLRLQMFSGMPGLTIDGPVGTTYRIEYETNLAAIHWTKLIDLSLPSNPFTFFDAGAANTSTRFYRVVAP